MSSSDSHNYRTSRRTFSGKCRVRGEHKRAARNEGRPRIGQIHIPARNMPATIIHKAWLADGTQVAICQVNDLFVAARFDAYEQVIGKPVEFKTVNARTNAMAWCRDWTKRTRGF